MYIIIGLGNPGREYDNTKHNVGFRTIDKLAEKHNVDIWKFKHKAFVGEFTIKGEKGLLVKPQTYMNLSGESVREILSFYKVPIENMIVVFDDTSLPAGMIRIREKGSAGGHNGIKSIIAHVGGDVFNRVRVGIGEKPSGWDLAEYVLSKFTKDEEPLMVSGIEKAVDAVEIFLNSGIKSAMNKFNVKVKEKKPEKEEVKEEEASEKESDSKNTEILDNE